MKRVQVVLTACLAWSVAACNHKLPPLTQQEQQTVTELTANMKTRCVGRYLIDMPGDAAESGNAEIWGVYIAAKAMTEDAYQQEITRREAELKATKSIDAHPFLYAANKVLGGSAYYFVHRGTIRNDPSRRHIEGYKWDRGYRFLLKIKAYDYLHPDQTDDPIVRKMIVKNNFPDKTDLVLNLLEKLRGRPTNEIPTEPGVCFAGGFLSAPAGTNERVDTQFGLNRMKDVLFDIGTTPDIPASTTLLQRVDSLEVRTAFKEANGSLVRKGVVDLHGLKAEEWLIEGPRPGGGRGHSFSLTANEMSSGPATPYLALDLNTGGQVMIQEQLVKLDKASVTTGEAVGLWDAVSQTLRLRPGSL